MQPLTDQQCTPVLAQTDIFGTIVKFNDELAVLYAKRLKAETQLRVFELQSIYHAEAVEELHAATKARNKVCVFVCVCVCKSVRSLTHCVLCCLAAVDLL